MCWASSKHCYLLASVIGVLACLPSPVAAEGGVVSASGTGRDTPEAIVALLRAAVAKNFKDEPAALSKSVLQNEIIPNASSFVQSYRIVEGGRAGQVSISANLDLDVIRGLFAVTPARLEASGARALVVVRGARLPANVPAAKGELKPADPYLVLEAAGKERFSRRQFEVVGLSADEMQALGGGEDPAAPELLRGLGARAEARLALGISARYEEFENENSHNKDQRLVVSATMLDVRSGAVLGRSVMNVADPKGRRDQYVADLQKSLAEESKDLFQEVFVAAGRKLGRAASGEGYSVLRVQYPSNAVLVGKFRGLLESAKGVRSVVEHSVRRGAFDFAIRPPMDAAALTKLVKGLSSEEILVNLQPAPGAEDGGPTPLVAVQVAPKVVAPAEPVEEIR